MLFNS
jgi:hypothetical protein